MIRALSRQLCFAAASVLLVMVSASWILLARPVDGKYFRRVSAGKPKDFEYVPFIDVRDRLVQLEKMFPELVEVVVAQERWELPHAGVCSKDGDDCEQVFIRIRDKRHGMVLSDLPQVFFSGNLHGNEQVGPMASLALVELLLASTVCDQGLEEKHIGCASAASGDRARDDPSLWWALESVKVGGGWLRSLVANREIVVLPISNAVGYYRNQREEAGRDPNRDFPIGLGKGSTKCMTTIVARAMNEMWRESLFQTAVTFHGGMQAIAYEWGSPDHADHKSTSPDDRSQVQLARVMRDVAGAFPTKKYPVGKMHDVVYDVRGGMEDWGYSGSWDDKGMSSCKPTSFGGYPESRTKDYPDGALRCANVLVETSDMKRPAESTLGDSSTLWIPRGGSGDGHVPRNVRLALSVVDLAEPYAAVYGASIHCATDGQTLDLNWNVGGALEVKESWVAAFPFPAALPRQALFHSPIPTRAMARVLGIVLDEVEQRADQPREAALDAAKKSIGVLEANLLTDEVWDGLKRLEWSWIPKVRALCSILDGNGTEAGDGDLEKKAGMLAISPSLSSATFWSDSQGLDATNNLLTFATTPIFTSSLTIPHPLPAGTASIVVVAAAANVDPKWEEQPTPPSPVVAPQSHLVRARRDPTWVRWNNGKVVRGRRVFVSSPVLLSHCGHVAPSTPHPSASPTPLATPSLTPTPTPPVYSTSTTTTEADGERWEAAANKGSGEIWWLVAIATIIVMWAWSIHRNIMRRAALRRTAGRALPAARCGAQEVCGCFNPELWGPEAGKGERPRTVSSRIAAVGAFIGISPDTSIALEAVQSREAWSGAPASTFAAPSHLSTSPSSTSTATGARDTSNWTQLGIAAEDVLGVEVDDHEPAPTTRPQPTEEDWMIEKDDDDGDLGEGGKGEGW